MYLCWADQDDGGRRISYIVSKRGCLVLCENTTISTICILRQANSRIRVASGARQYWGKVFVVALVSISLAYLSISLASPIYNTNYRSH